MYRTSFFSRFRRIISMVVFGCLLAGFAGSFVEAQTIRYTDNAVDQTMRGSLNVDPSTLGMSFSVSLGNYPGRGVGLPVTVNYSSKVWRLRYMTSIQGMSSVYTHNMPEFGEHSAAGWTTTLDAPYWEYLPQSYDQNGDPQDVAFGCDPNYYVYWVERVILHLPGGVTHELRRSPDAPAQRTCAQGAPVLSGTYVAVDGSRVKFEYVSSSEQIISMPDGSRYILSSSTAGQYIDRNGNTLSYGSGTWTDTLGRTFSFALDDSATGTQNLYLPGVDRDTNGNNNSGAERLGFQFVWDYLSNVLSSGSVRYKGNLICQSPYNSVSPSLFTTLSSQDRVCTVSSSSTTGVLFDPVVLKQIVLPNGRSYSFTYTIYGEIDKVTLPTGGYQRYVYGQLDPLDSQQQLTSQAQTNRGVTSHYVSATGQSGDEKQWQYAVSASGADYTVTVTAPDSTKAERKLHRPNGYAPYGYDDSRAGRAYEERAKTASNVMWRRNLTEWTQTDTGASYYATRDPRPVKQVEILLDTSGDALTKTTTMAYDSDLNVIETKSHDYATYNSTSALTASIGSFSAGTLLREDETTFYLSDSDYSASWTNYRNRHLIALPTKQIVKNGSGTVVAATEISYDERSLATYGGTIPGWTDPSTTVRGNPTTVERWQNFNGSSFDTHPSGSVITTKSDYDQLGNVVKTTDANNKETVIVYTDSFSDGSTSHNSYAYPTRTDTPVPDSSGYYASSTALSSYTTYDFPTGRITKKQDANDYANSKATEYFYLTASNLNRLDKVTLPDGGETSYVYNDDPDDPGTGNPGNLYIWQKTKQDSGGTLIEDRAYFDRIGRPWRSAHKESSSQWSVRDTKYDDLSRVSQTSNPYFLTTITDPPTTGSIWTTMTYDALGRVLTVTTPDSAVVTTGYNGNEVTVTDQADKVRRSVTDGLGRLKQVVEDPSGSLNYTTNYTYSTMGDLIKVEQGSQYRYFLYDSLSRLLRAKNPEQDANTNIALTPPSDQSTGNTAWALKYVYDSNGNLTSKVDARNVTTSYGYDALNRNVWTSYTDSTPGTERHYDTATNGKGRLSYHVSFNPHPVSGYAYSRTVVNAYDAMGRVTSQSQGLLNAAATQWYDYTTTRTYNLAGEVTGQTYPSSRTVTNSYNSGGRLTSFVGTLGDGTSRNYATGITYTAAGLMSQETFGMQASTLYHNLHYNNRQQLVDIRVGDSSSDEWNWSRGALIYYYGTTARNGWDPFANSTDNNGNVLRQVNYVPLSGGGNVIPQLDDYSYDAVNRITSVTEAQQNSSGTWTYNLFTQSFGYDRWGNRTVSCSPCQTGVTGDTFTISTTTNRITAKNSTGLTYDAAGNQTYDATGDRWFDGENRMHKAVQGGTTSHYVYDADGKRVRRIIGSTETWMVYGIDGELVGEYAVNGASGSPQKEYGYRGGQMLIVAQASPLEIRWTVTDHLGTPRMNIRGTGTDGGSLASVTRHDYLPFGEELFAGVGLRSSSSHGYEPPSDGVRQKLANSERDNETGLDFMQARYCGSIQGRFTSVDPFDPILGKQGAEDAVAAEKEWRSYLRQPQHWNRYVYVLNNPLKYVDPDGMDPIVVNLNIIFDQNSNYTDAEKQKIRETYIARTQAAFGKIEIKFNITEMTGTASNLANGNRSIATGSIPGAINAFFTKSEALPSSEVTDSKAGSIFISTGRIADTDDLTHGIVHAAGIASGQNGYPSLPSSPLPGIWGEAARRSVDFYKERSAEAVTRSIVKYLNGDPQIHYAVFPMSTARHKQQDLQVLKTGLNRKFPHYGP